MAYGRGAWNTAGVGGTLSVDGDAPGPYYVLANGPDIVGLAGWRSLDPNRRAVHGAVLAIQGALTRRLRTQFTQTGRYDAMTADAVARFQGIHQGEPGITVWAGVGPDTAKALFLPDLKRVTRPADLPWRVICGVITAESNWDPGAVGYFDPRDVGLAQISGINHPDWTERERLLPRRSFRFVADYLTESLTAFDGDLDAAVASYNLGIGGANSWVRAGRPDVWTPAGSTSPRDVRLYIDRILGACA